jgi:hypothetical protein
LWVEACASSPFLLQSRHTVNITTSFVNRSFSLILSSVQLLVSLSQRPLSFNIDTRSLKSTSGPCSLLQRRYRTRNGNTKCAPCYTADVVHNNLETVLKSKSKSSHGTTTPSPKTLGLWRGRTHQTSNFEAKKSNMARWLQSA